MGAMVNYGPIFVKFGTIIYVYIKLIWVEYQLYTNILIELMAVKVIFWKGVYMGAMVNNKAIFLKIGTLI